MIELQRLAAWHLCSQRLKYSEVHSFLVVDGLIDGKALCPLTLAKVFQRMAVWDPIELYIGFIWEMEAPVAGNHLHRKSYPTIPSQLERNSHFQGTMPLTLRWMSKRGLMNHSSKMLSPLHQLWKELGLVIKLHCRPLKLSTMYSTSGVQFIMAFIYGKW